MSDSTITLNFAPARPKEPSKPIQEKKTAAQSKFSREKGPFSNKRKLSSVYNSTNERKSETHTPPPEVYKPVSSLISSLNPTEKASKKTRLLSQNKGPLQENVSEDTENPPLVQSVPKTIISSLFTKNPKISKEHLKETKFVPLKPSNGILTDAPNFIAAGLDKVLANHLKNKMKMEKPTTIQSQVLSFLDNFGYRDMIIQAQTGSGKTLSFLLPIVDRLIRASGISNTPDSFRPSRTSGVLAVILAPTRELARQIYDVLVQLLNYPVVSDKQLQRYHWIVPGLVVGGDKKASEKSRLRKGINILVATPGRFLDHLQNTSCMDVGSLKWLVLDEGDRFLELGLQETLKTIFSILTTKQPKTNSFNRGPFRGSWFWNSQSLPRERMTMMVSATLNKAVHTLAEYSLTNPIHISQGNFDKNEDSEDSDLDEPTQSLPGKDSFATPQQLTQKYLVVPAKLRLVTLLSLLKSALSEGNGKVIVFMLTCDEVEFYHSLFSKTNLDSDEAATFDFSTLPGYFPEAEKFFELGQPVPGLPLLKLHGNLEQSYRSGTYKTFCKLESGVLFCTDVAARGLDLPFVTKIVQFDPPADIKDYVHRVGRTARLGRAGSAILFLLPSELDYLGHLASLKIHLHPGTAEDSLRLLSLDGQSDFQSAATYYQNAFEKHVLSSPTEQALADKAMLSSVRAYATHSSSEKAIFHIKRLHLGHWAKSFALREAPSVVTRRTGKNSKEETHDNTGSHPSYASKLGSLPSSGYFDPTSEFSSGSTVAKFPKKKSRKLQTSK